MLNSLLAGSADGEIKIWDIPLERCLRKLVGHTSAVRGIAFAPDGETCVSCSTDATIKLWKVPYAPFEAAPVESEEKAVMAFEGKHAFRGIDHHWQRNTFVTSSAVVEVWDHERSEPIHTFSWGADTVLSARFNPVRRAPGLAPAACAHMASQPAYSSHCPKMQVLTA